MKALPRNRIMRAVAIAYAALLVVGAIYWVSIGGLADLSWFYRSSLL